MASASAGRWFLLIHCIPPKPNYLRVKVGRKLQRLGAVAIKNSVYALPNTHEGDRCTFEVLVGKMGSATPGLVAIGEVVHDIDLRDGKFGRPETPGIELVIAAIALAHREDDARLERASAVVEDMNEYFRREA